jgi:cytochrome b involved in lipid metabolism
MVLTTPALHNQKKERTSFTQEELRKLWVLHGQVYDFTDFVKYHPAGSKAILLGRGRDCTVLFESYHTILPSDALLEKYRVSAPNVRVPSLAFITVSSCTTRCTLLGAFRDYACPIFVNLSYAMNGNGEC